MKDVNKVGKLFRIAGPVVVATGIDAEMYDLVRIGKEKLMGEVIEIQNDKIIIQVYEDTSGIKPGEPVYNTGKSLSVELGPGLLTSIYDGIQRPLPVLRDQMGDFILRGVDAPGLDQKKKWDFKATAKKGDKVKTGEFLGQVEETQGNLHKIMVPFGVSGTLKEINSGKFTVNDVIGYVEDATKKTHELKLKQYWPVRLPRPVAKKLTPNMPLITGQRVFDSLFTLAKGGVAAIPGPFGAGKCVTGDTKIFVNNELVDIKDVFDNAKGKIISKPNEIFIELENPLQVWTFNNNKIEQTIATHVFQGTTNKLVKIKTRSGREVKLTSIHKLFKLDEKLNIVETESQHLTEGDYIISPRKIIFDGKYQPIAINFECRVADIEAITKMVDAIELYTKSKNIALKEFAKIIGVSYDTLMNFYLKRNTPTISFVRKISEITEQEIRITKIKVERDSLIINIPDILSEELAEFVGYVMSDGMTKGSSSVHFFNKKKELRDRFKFLLKELFNLESKEYWANTVEAVRTNSVALVKLLHSLNMPLSKKSRTVNIPKQLFISPDSVIKSFLIAYISCDGHIGTKELEITSASKEIIDSISYLLLRLGILQRTAMRIIDGNNYYRLFIPKREAIKIHPYYNQERYFNSTDIVPMTSSLFRELLGNIKPFELEKEGISTAAYYVNQNLTAQTMQKIAGKMQTKVQNSALNSQLQKFAAALDYIFCDEIISIEIIDEITKVYDITVPGTHNFIGGNKPMILHNTVSQQQLAKWCDAEIIVYIGCGERGNEMTEVLTEFPHLTDPKTGKPLMNRTVLIANTSNMPVAAREASVYTGITIAEYYRDMGYDVALMADSTSRWAEAMREISSRLEEMPGEEGYPAYLSTKLAQFYERAGRVQPLGTKKEGSVTVIGAVSPPGGDFSEPVTQNTLRVTKTFWALDAKLAQRRHFPSINWLTSYSLYLDTLELWFADNVNPDWRQLTGDCMKILQQEEKLLEIVQLVGSDALPEKEQLTLDAARLIREFLLQQNAYHEIDTFSSLQKTRLIMKTILTYYLQAQVALEKGVRVQRILDIKSKTEIGNAKFNKDFEGILNGAQKKMEAEIRALS